MSWKACMRLHMPWKACVRLRTPACTCVNLYILCLLTSVFNYSVTSLEMVPWQHHCFEMYKINFKNRPCRKYAAKWWCHLFEDNVVDKSPQRALHFNQKTLGERCRWCNGGTDRFFLEIWLEILLLYCLCTLQLHKVYRVCHLHSIRSTAISKSSELKTRRRSSEN